MKKIMIAVVSLLLSLFITVSAKNEKKYLALGDSITYGHTLDDINKAYPYLYAKELGYSLDNEAVVGDTSTDLINRLDNYDLSSYDFITLCIGANDILEVLKEAISEHSDPIDLYNYLSKVENDKEFNDKINNNLEKFKTNYRYIIGKLKEANTNVVILNVYNPYKNIEAANLNKSGEKYIRMLNDIIMENRSDLEVLDVYGYYNKNNTSKKSLVNAGNASFDPHPNINGQKAIYDLLVKKHPNYNKVITIVIILVPIGLLLLLGEVYFFFKLVFKNKKKKKMPKKVDAKEKIIENNDKSSRFSRN